MISQKKKKCLCEFHDLICEECKNKFELKDLTIHRLFRGFNGGDYSDHRKLKVLCKNCHKKYHFGEFPSVRVK